MALNMPGRQTVPGKIELPENVVVSRLDELANWCRKNSLWPMPFATACCGIELMATGAAKHDLARFGAEVFRFARPSQGMLPNWFPGPRWTSWPKQS